MRFVVMIRPTRTGYSVDVPDLPGCIAAAKTVRGVRKLITRAIELHLELMQQSGERIPPPRERVEFVIDPEAGVELCTWVEVEAPAPVSST